MSHIYIYIHYIVHKSLHTYYLSIKRTKQQTTTTFVAINIIGIIGILFSLFSHLSNFEGLYND